MTISILGARHEKAEFWQLSGITNWKKLSHTPLIAFVESDGEMQVRIIDKADDAFSLPEDTKIIAQWKGEWSSDFFEFTAKQFCDERMKYRMKYGVRA